MFDVQEIGDVENWARSIEGDMLTVTTVLDYVHKGMCVCGHDNTFTFLILGQYAVPTVLVCSLNVVLFCEQEMLADRKRYCRWHWHEMESFNVSLLHSNSAIVNAFVAFWCCV